MLNHPVVARVLVAAAHLVALEDHRRLAKVEAVLEHAVLVVPTARRVVRTPASVL